MRYRGDNNYHWLYKQKSFRIKLDSESINIFEMGKKFNLLNPPHITYLRDYVYYKKAKELGLISPDFYPVRMYVNGEYMGVYMYLSQLDESLLRKRKLMPGSVYSGDGAPNNKYGISDLWFNQRYWVKASARNAEQKGDRTDIAFFIDSIINSSESEFEYFIDTYFDKKNMFTYLALDRFYGSNHHDFSHNHKLYFDPYKGKYQFIAWDIRFWSGKGVKELAKYPLSFRLRENPYYDAEIDKILYSLISNNEYDSSIEEYALMLKNHKNELMSDKYKDTGTWLPKLFPTSFWYLTPYSYDDLFAQMVDEKRILGVRKKVLLNILDDANIDSFINGNFIYFKVYGNSPVNVIVNGSSIELFPGRRWLNNGELKYSLLASGKNDVVNTHKLYAFDTVGLDSVSVFNSLEFTNTITGKKILSDNVIFDLDIPVTTLEVAPDIKEEVMLSGVNRVTNTLVFDEDVEIAPGTVFSMAKGVSIYFYGKVTAIGTRENPVKFIAEDPQNPWGLVAVQGKATTGSIFEHVEFENGSTDTRNLIHYTSPFNIHDTDWFEVRNCKIGRNFVGDDAMHVAYAKGIIDGCEFYDARSDALDIDISDVTVTNNIFYKAGNDGLDIMTTTMTAKNNVFIDAGDKGISVGEWSEASITDSLFLRTGIGLEVKDKSKVKANNLVIVDSKDKAINLYNKNKRYDEGGFLNGDSIFLLGNTKFKADKRSGQKIKHVIENTLPDLKQYEWYESLQNTTYKKFVDKVEVKYAQ